LNSNTNKNEENVVIDGLENFSFIDTPEEEKELRLHFNKFIE
jgi:PHD/YefM family antitoxin component YafN of YafNO toxin-antitoxin module